MIPRRAFILAGAAVGGGLLIRYGLQTLDDGDAAQKFAAAGRRAAPLNAWLKISTDGTVTCGIHRAEMGQGVTTTLAMLLAEELDADWSKVRFEFTPIDRDYYNFGMLGRGQPLGDATASWRAATGTWAFRQLFHALGMSMTISSSSTVDAWDTLRPAGAAARQMLLAAAAQQWDTTVASLTTEPGFVIDSAGQRRLSYGELAESASRQLPPGKVPLKDPNLYRLVGHNPPRLDTPMKVDGTAVFGMDVRLPEMLYAAVVHSPVAGTRVADFSTHGAEGMAGVQHIGKAGAPGRERAVAVVATNSWQALQAAQHIEIRPVPQAGELADHHTMRLQYRNMLQTAEAILIRDDADMDRLLATANAPAADASQGTVTPAARTQVRVQAEYSVPFLAHACMEPMNCTALYTGNRLEIWAPTQAASIARDVAARLAGLDNSQVTLHTTLMGGGLGRRAEMDFVEQAVSVAIAVPNRPVKLFWSREQDIRHDAYRPAAACRLTGLVNNQGSLTALDCKLVTQSVVASYETRTPTPRGADAQSDKSVVEAMNPPVYPLDNLRLAFVPVDSHVPVGYWRSVAHSWATFFMESFIDEVALAAQQPPLEFRRIALAGSPRHLQVLDALAQAWATGARSVERVSNDSRANEPDAAYAHGVGYAIAESHGTVVAHAIEVATLGGAFHHVTRVVCAVDCGPVVHPDNVNAQVEGSVIDGLSAALYGDIAITDGRTVPGNFDAVRLLRLAECPPVEVHIVASQANRPGGIGEPAVPGVAPALVNAIYAATGKRIRDLPVAGR